MTVFLNEGEFGVAKIEKAHRLVLGCSDGRVKLCDAKAAIDGELDEHFESGNIVIKANVGKRPQEGVVFGVKTEPYVRQVFVPNWGDVFFFRRCKKSERAKFLKEMSNVGRKYAKLGIANPKVFVTIIRPFQNGKYAGMYRHIRKEEKQDVIFYFQEDLRKDAVYYAAHEYAHGVWFNAMDKEDRSEWIKLYAQHNDPQRYGGNRLATVLNGIVECEGIHTYRKQAEGDEKSILAQALKHIARVHKVREHELEDLLASGEDIKSLWPTEPVWLHKHTPWVTDYSGESPAELFAEAVSHWIAGKKVPKVVQKLVDSTVKKIKSKGGNVKSKDEDVSEE